MTHPQSCERRDHADAVGKPPTHADDAALADVNACFAHSVKRAEAVLVRVVMMAPDILPVDPGGAE